MELLGRHLPASQGQPTRNLNSDINNLWNSLSVGDFFLEAGQM